MTPGASGGEEASLPGSDLSPARAVRRTNASSIPVSAARTKFGCTDSSTHPAEPAGRLQASFAVREDRPPRRSSTSLDPAHDGVVELLQRGPDAGRSGVTS